MSVPYATLFTMRGATGITFQPHQIHRLPRKMTLMIDLRHIWNVIYNARSNKHHRPTSPNTASATQNCTPKSKTNLPKKLKRQFQCATDPNTIRPWTRHLAPARSPRLLFALRRRILHWKLQYFALRPSIQISPNTVPATKSDIRRSPNAPPATKNDSHGWCPWHMKRHLQGAEQQASPSNLTQQCACHVKKSRLWSSSHMKHHLQCAEQQASPSNLTKCCPCHEKWCASLFTMRGATGSTLQLHQILRLPRKITFQNPREIFWKQLKWHLQSGNDSSMIRSDHELVISHPPVRRGHFFRASETHYFVLKITTFHTPAIYPNFTKYCGCHEK